MSGMPGAFRIFVIVLAVVAGLAPIDSRLVERWYSTGIYPVVQGVLTPISNLFPFAVLDVLLLGGLMIAGVVLVRSVQRKRRKKTWKPILLTLTRLVSSAAMVYLAFLLLWGLNYRRISMSERLLLERDHASSQVILDLGRTSVAQLNMLHQPAHEEGWRTSPWRERGYIRFHTHSSPRCSSMPRYEPLYLVRRVNEHTPPSACLVTSR